MITAARKRSFEGAAFLRATLDAATAQRVLRVALLPCDSRVVVNDVVPLDGWVMSDQPFVLRVSFAVAEPTTGLARVVAEWAGEPFVVESLIGLKDCERGSVDVRFGKEQTLPTGPASFHVTLTTNQGARGAFRITCAVLPSNPFSLGLSPLDHFVTGSFSLRSVRDGANYVTAMSVTLSNGDAAPVAVHPAYHWEFWDGPVGSGTLVEQGNGAFPGGDITVAGHSTWGGWIVFTSPPGSGVFGKLDSKEDLGFNLTMNRVVGGAVNDEITARTMFRFGRGWARSPSLPRSTRISMPRWT